MKTMKYFYLCLAAMSMATFTACTEDLEYSSVDHDACIKIEVTDEFAQATTRANYSGFPATTFEEGDQIGVYAVNTSNSAVSSNVAFTRQSDGSWTPASTVVYNPDYKYYAYFPYKSSTPTFVPGGSGADGKFTNFLNSNTFWLADQSTKASFTTSNLMWAEGIVTGTRTVKFTMAHKRGLAIIGNATNKWYYTDAAGTKYEMTQVFSGNIPYTLDGTQYYLLKPNTATSVGGLSLRASEGRYMTSVGGEITGTISSWSYRTSSNLGSSWGSWTSSKPSWLTITTNTVDGEPTEFLVTTTNSTSTTTSKGTGASRTVTGDATLKAASPVSDVDLSMVDNAGVDRASRMTANCYLVHAPGTYKLPLVYGNAIKNGSTNSTAYYTSQTSNTLQRLVNHAGSGITDPWLKNNSATPDGARLIWEDVKGMISSVGISGDYLTFTVDEDNIAEGNAVVAATMSGTVVWSWHIWVTPQTLSSTTSIATGSRTYQVAPVNVGQVDGLIKAGATVYAGDLCQVRATANGITVEFQVTAKDYTYGGTNYYNPSPYYQWGRKDAERPCTGAYNASGTYAQNPTLVSGAYSIGTTIQNPDNHYYNSSNYGPYNENKYNYWDMNQTSTGNITTATVKTVYDPCPPGFCVPTGNLYYYANSNSGQTAWQSTPPGRNWTVNGTPIFFPASGLRYISSGSLSSVGSYGYYWSASAYDSNNGRNLYFNSSGWYWNSNGRAYGFPVRAVAEE
ncbi:MAG: hypothetical protein IJ929_05560 [Prevotella sp.]|nr:hypothetical protein [Prevotella sp.]